MESRDDRHSGALEVRFLDDGREGPTPPLLVTAELGQLFARAAELNRNTEDQPQLSFGSLLAAFAYPAAAHTVAHWVQSHAERVGANLLPHRERDRELWSRPAPLELRGRPLSRSMSARRAINEAVEVSLKARRSFLHESVRPKANQGQMMDRAMRANPPPVDAAHLFAAFLWLPDYHPTDYDVMKLDVSAWRPAFAAAMAEMNPVGQSFWRGLIEPGFGEAELPPRVPIDELQRWPLSRTAGELFSAATQLANEEAGSALVSSRSLVAALLDGRLSQKEGSAKWFLEAIGSGAKSWPKLRKKYYLEARHAPHGAAIELTQDIASMLELSRELARSARLEADAEVSIHLRHLIAALLIYTNREQSNAHKLLLELGCDLSRVRAAFLASVLTWDQEDAAAWQRWLGPGDETAPSDDEGANEEASAEPLAQPNWALARVVSDRVSGRIPADRDRLDVKRPAQRFAKLLCARDVEPPIALGLFGNWGTGKSFFMGLMQSHVDDLTNGHDVAYVRKAAQIDFNAWHYQDTNLWASLALRIFDGLAARLAPEGAQPSELQAEKAKLNQQMASSTQRKAEAKAQRDAALKRRAETTRLLEAKLLEREQTATKQLDNAWKVLKADESFPALSAELERAARALGLGAHVENAQALRKLHRELQLLAKQGGAVTSALSARFQPKNLWLTLPAIAIVIAGSVGVGKLVDWVNLTYDEAHPIPGGAALAQLAAFVSAAAGWLSRQARAAQCGVDQATQLETKLKETVQKMEAEGGAGERQREAMRLRGELSKLDKEICSATEQVSEAERRIAETTAEIERIESGGLVYDFLRKRQASAQYQGQLGLVSTLRDDLADLGRRMSELAAESRIERIILYIDDLDRCQPSKVVEVLQAVHLLLAFPYFHVVVGVDARWLRRSLEETYERAPGTLSASSSGGEFSAHDYLEKIFQIPYALAPLQKPGFEQLIDGMLKSRSEWTLEQTEKRASRERKQVTTQEGRDSAEASGAGRTSGIEGDGAGPREGSGSEEPPAELAGRKESLAGPKSERDAAPRSSAAPVVFFEDYEEKFIKGLYEFIDRPRLAGRFVNVYRLLRARAADEQSDHGFADTKDAVDYRVALLLLAVNVGHPQIAGHFFGALRDSLCKTWQELVQGERERERGDLPDVARAHYRRLFDQLAALPVAAPENLSDYRRWIEPIVCFSFDLPSALGRPGAVADHVQRGLASPT
ncbi:MAG TPA: P-loop NTPase fold protein [Polyangiaceae bacterium]|nr:P-loop NTPase fold protein [Polyangiaceae bacterium]